MKVLISGCGVAGLVLAANLSARGHDVSLVEIAPRVRTTGAPIDVRGEALGVARDMGVVALLRERRLGSTQGVRFVDEHGDVVAPFPADAISDSPEDIEIAREDLIEILHGQLPSAADIRFSATIERLHDDGAGVDVRLSDGHTGRYDLLIGADGIHSTVRRLVFGPEEDYNQHRGFYAAIARLGRDESGEPSMLCNIPGRLAGIFRYHDQADGFFLFRSDRLSYDFTDLATQKAHLARAYEGMGWRVPELVAAALDDDELYFDAVCQITMDQWHRGRVALIGDAAHCATLLSGRGTSLAMTGAYYLAEELDAARDDHTMAFGRYEKRQRPHVVAAQQSVTSGGDMMVPATQEALDQRNRALAASA